MSIKTKMYHEQQKPTIEEKAEMVDFLYKHLENFGDPKGDIEKCINPKFSIRTMKKKCQTQSKQIYPKVF